MRGSIIVAGARVGTVLTGFGVNMLLARLLPLDQLGAFFLVASIVQVGALIALGGLNQSAVPLISGAMADMGLDRIRPILRGITLLLIGTIGTAALVVLGAFEWIAGSIGLETVSTVMIGLTAIWLVSRSIVQGLSHLLRSFEKMALFGLSETFLYNTLFFGVCAIWFVKGTEPSLEDVVRAAAFVAAVGIPVTSIFLWFSLPILPNNQGVDVAEVLRISAPLWIIVLAGSALGDAHLWISSAFGSEESAALFGVALRVARLLALPLLAVNLAIGPEASKLWRQGEVEKLQRLMRLSATAVLGVSAGILVLFMLAGPSFLGHLFGEEFTAAWPAFVLLLVGRSVNAATGSPMMLLMVSSAQRSAMVYAIISAAVGIAASLVLGRIGPLWGVAVGSSVAVIIQNLLALAHCQLRLGIKTYPLFQLKANDGVSGSGGTA